MQRCADAGPDPRPRALQERVPEAHNDQRKQQSGGAQSCSSMSRRHRGAASVPVPMTHRRRTHRSRAWAGTSSSSTSATTTTSEHTPHTHTHTPKTVFFNTTLSRAPTGQRPDGYRLPARPALHLVALILPSLRACTWPQQSTRPLLGIWGSGRIPDRRDFPTRAQWFPLTPCRTPYPRIFRLITH